MYFTSIVSLLLISCRVKKHHERVNFLKRLEVKTHASQYVRQTVELVEIIVIAFIEQFVSRVLSPDAWPVPLICLALER